MIKMKRKSEARVSFPQRFSPQKIFESFCQFFHSVFFGGRKMTSHGHLIKWFLNKRCACETNIFKKCTFCSTSRVAIDVNKCLEKIGSPIFTSLARYAYLETILFLVM